MRRLLLVAGSATLLALTALPAGPLTSPAHAHPGGLDANGCHTNRKTGEYHCHRAGAGLPPPAPAPSPAPRRSGSGGVYYANCAQARAAGAAPIRRGEPGYRAGLDRDNDGIACE